MNRSRTHRIFKSLAVWIPSVLFGLLFVMQGLMKLTDGDGWSTRFQDWGYPGGFSLVIGVLELLAGIGLVIPRVAKFAAALLGVIMVGACLTHSVHSETTNVWFTLGLASALFLLAYSRGLRAGKGTKPGAGVSASDTAIYDG